MKVMMKHPVMGLPLKYTALQVAQECDGFSGRALRKLPFLAHACLQEAHAQTGPRYPPSLPGTLAMIAALRSAVVAEKGDRNALYG